MRSPRGFGKNYFTFSAVQAHSVQPHLQGRRSRVTMLLRHRCTLQDEEASLLNEDPPLELLTLPCTLNIKACHCNCFDTLKTRLALLINLFIPRCPYYTTCFAFRRTGVHPPQNSSF